MSRKIFNIVFAGTPDFAVPTLTALANHSAINVIAVLTQPDRPLGRRQIITPPPVKRAAIDLGIPILQPRSIKNPSFMRTLASYAPDAVVLVAYGKIITPALLAIPHFGWVNIHASLLPKYRGASPIQAALLHGDVQTGVTLMRLDEGLDTGPLIAQRTIPIRPTDTAGSLHDSLASLGATIAAEALPEYLSGTLTPHPQAITSQAPTTTIKTEQARIDWRQSDVQILRHIRAYTPWPGAYTVWSGKRFIIIEATTTAHTVLAPGHAAVYKKSLLVGTGTRPISVLTAQLAGKKPQSSTVILNGYPKLGEAVFSD